MTLKRAVLLGLVAFALALVIVLPARWIGAALPDGIHCEDWGGSIWRGRCTDLVVSAEGKVALRLTELRWRLRPAALLRLALAAEFESAWPEGRARGMIEVRTGGAIRLRETSGQSRVDRRLVGALPPGWNGVAELRALEFDWQDGRVDRLGGDILARDLVDARGTTVGSYQLTFPPGSTLPITGQLRDTGGPVEVDAQLRLDANRSWKLEGRMRARDAGNAPLNRQLDIVSGADAAGWRRLSAEGTY